MQKGITSLHLASSSGHIEVVELLLDRGANVNIADEVNTLQIIMDSWLSDHEVATVKVYKM